MTTEGIPYPILAGYLALLDRSAGPGEPGGGGVRTITVAHYVPSADRRTHTVPKQAVFDAMRKHASLLEDALVPFARRTLQVVFRFQDFHGRSDWWMQKLEEDLPCLKKTDYKWSWRVQNDECKYLKKLD